MGEVYQTQFKGELTLKPLKAKAIEKLLRLIEQKGLSDVMALSQDNQTLYVSGSIDNTLELMEKFFLKIHPLVDISDSRTIQVQGASASDRYDLQFEEDGLYIVYYKLVKETMVKYTE